MLGERTALRRRIGVSKAHTAKMVGCSIPTVTLFEADRFAVGAEKRAPLDRIYAGFAELAATADIIKPTAA